MVPPAPVGLRIGFGMWKNSPALTHIFAERTLIHEPTSFRSHSPEFSEIFRGPMRGDLRRSVISFVRARGRHASAQRPWPQGRIHAADRDDGLDDALDARECSQFGERPFAKRSRFPARCQGKYD